jgi:muconolactone D-isomerase
MGAMREFIVEITTTFPESMSQSEVDELRAAEAVRAKELTASGNLARLWRPIGEMRSIGSLPLSLWMAFKVTSVQPHPNDPGW